MKVGSLSSGVAVKGRHFHFDCPRNSQTADYKKLGVNERLPELVKGAEVACRIPVVAAATGSMRELLDDEPQCLFEPENDDDLAASIRSQIIRPTVLKWHVPTWDELGMRLGSFLENIFTLRA